MPSITLATVLSDAGTVAALFSGFIGVALAIKFGPRLLKAGLRLITRG